MFPFHAGGISYLLHERTIKVKMKVYWDIYFVLNQSFFTKVGSQRLIQFEFDGLITGYMDRPRVIRP